MNTFVAKKIGEVLAFARVGKDTSKKGEKGFVEVLGEECHKDTIKQFGELEKRIVAISEEHGVTSVVEEKAKKTTEKVTAMRDVYVGDKWDDAGELLEWSGFYVGAAIVHWKLVHGAAKALTFEDLERLSKQSIDFYTSMLDSVGKMLEKIGGEGAKSK
ncbi:MAG TPA: hypothetical protein PLF31_01775 [Candidatus Paceibacterota bacterium]|nr:hypothetical protein [Candidatus Paceibacterota bacterium]